MNFVYQKLIKNGPLRQYLIQQQQNTGSLTGLALISMKAKAPATQAVIPLVTAWRQGFFTNLLNVKCILYFLAIFSYVPIANMTLSFALVIEIELFCVVVAWFSLLSVILTHPRWKHALQRATPTIVGLMGWLLLFVGAWLVLQGIFKSAL
jgi:threonine/homoserine/homoserine lactone efflux protein